MSSSRAECGSAPQRRPSSVLNSCPFLSYPHVLRSRPLQAEWNVEIQYAFFLRFHYLMEIRTAVWSPFCACFLTDAGQDLWNEVSVLLSCWEHKGQSIHLFGIFFINYKYADILSSWTLFLQLWLHLRSEQRPQICIWSEHSWKPFISAHPYLTFIHYSYTIKITKCTGLFWV